MNWHPAAIRVPHSDAGAFVSGIPAKLVWHTTEGSSLPHYAGGQPHFTFHPQTGALYQHIPINRAAKTLKHPAGTVETNRANAIQVELIGFASQTHLWTDAAYKRIAQLARWIEANAGVESQCSVKFGGGSTVFTRLLPGAWLQYSGHIGHQHVPHNDHWDPGRFRIELVLAPAKNRKLKRWRRSHRIAHARARRVGWPLWLRERTRKLHRLIEREESRA
jgi:hypothetical protein